jgi:hypothetical protein
VWDGIVCKHCWTTKFGDPSPATTRKQYQEFKLEDPIEKLSLNFEYAKHIINVDSGYSQVWWACRTISELLLLPGPFFRSRISEIPNDAKIRELLSCFQLEYVRKSKITAEAGEFAKQNVAYLLERDVQDDMSRAIKFNDILARIAKIIPEYLKEHTQTERTAIESNLASLCKGLDSYEAVGWLVDLTLSAITANQAQRGSGYCAQTINLITGERSEVSDRPTDRMLEGLGIRLITCLDPHILDQCNRGQDTSFCPDNPDGAKKNYSFLLNRAIESQRQG